MHIKEVNNESWLVECGWKKSKNCPDKDVDSLAVLEDLDIPPERLSHSICQACNAVMIRDEGLELEPFEQVLATLEDLNDKEKVQQIIETERERLSSLLQNGEMSLREYAPKLLALTSIQAKNL